MTDDQADQTAADWATIWRSEWAAMALDRELAETLQRVAANALAGRASPNAPGCAGAEPPPRPASVADAPGAARDIADLQARVAELERRLAATGP